MTDPHAIDDLDALKALYGEPNPRSLTKETRTLTPAYMVWLERSPFFAIASSGADGLDCSPRGDATGHLLEVLDERTIAFADRPGNNRIDTLQNIVRDPRVGLLFLIPGINETLRINGRARITTDPALMARFEMNGKQPVTVIVVDVDAVYFQCARALMRSGLWNADAIAGKDDVPTAGQMLKGAEADFDAEAYDANAAARLKGNLY